MGVIHVSFARTPNFPPPGVHANIILLNSEIRGGGLYFLLLKCAVNFQGQAVKVSAVDERLDCLVRGRDIRLEDLDWSYIAIECSHTTEAHNSCCTNL